MFGFGTLLPWTNLTLQTARSRLSGWHFAKGSLTDGEREILYVGEGLLRLIDEAPKALVLITFYAETAGAPEQVALVSSVAKVQRVIIEHLAARGPQYSIRHLDFYDREASVAYAKVLNEGVDEGEFYSTQLVDLKD